MYNFQSKQSFVQERYKLAEPKAEDEENAIDLKITTDMTPDIVAQKILEMTNWKVLKKMQISLQIKRQIWIDFYFPKETNKKNVNVPNGRAGDRRGLGKSGSGHSGEEVNGPEERSQGVSNQWKEGKPHQMKGEEKHIAEKF